MANWSGQEVGFTPQQMPLRRGIMSSARRPSAIAAIPLRLPLHPPVNTIEPTIWLLGSMSYEIDLEHVPCVEY